MLLEYVSLWVSYPTVEKHKTQLNTNFFPILFPFFFFFFLAAYMGKTPTSVLLMCSIEQQLSKAGVPLAAGFLPLVETEGSLHRMLHLGTGKNSDIRGKNPETKPCWLAFVNSKYAVILSIRWYLTVEFFDLSWFLIGLFLFLKGLSQAEGSIGSLFFFGPPQRLFCHFIITIARYAHVVNQCRLTFE